jgi:hypothetical protein
MLQYIRVLTSSLVLAATPYCLAAKSVPYDFTVPPDGLVVLDRLVVAAESADWAALRSMMADEFKYSFGADRDSPDDAIEDWKKDPQVLKELVRVIGMGCKHTPDAYIHCSGEGGTNYRGALKRDSNGAWKLVWFIAGD